METVILAGEMSDAAIKGWISGGVIMILILALRNRGKGKGDK